MPRRLTEGAGPQTQGLDSLWCREPLGSGKRCSSEWVQPGAWGHLWQDKGGRISPVSLAGHPCAGYILHYGLRGGASTAPISPSASYLSPPGPPLGALARFPEYLPTLHRSAQPWQGRCRHFGLLSCLSCSSCFSSVGGSDKILPWHSESFREGS